MAASFLAIRNKLFIDNKFQRGRMKNKHISLSTKMVLGNILPLVLASTFIIVSFLIALNKAINTDIEKNHRNFD